MRPFLAAAVLVLAAAGGCDDKPVANRIELAGVWRLVRIDFAGFERAVLDFYVKSGIARDEAAGIARVQFGALIPEGIAGSGTVLRLGRDGEYSDNTGGSGRWALENQNIITIGIGGDRFAVSYSFASDSLVVNVSKAQFLKVYGRRSAGVDSVAIKLYRRVLPDEPDLMRLFFERVKSAPGVQPVGKRKPGYRSTDASGDG